MIHLLTGDNTYELEQRLAELVTGFDGDVERCDGEALSLEQLPDLFSGVTLFSSARLVVIKNASQKKSLWAVLAEWLERGIDNDVVFVEEHPDKRTKTYKWLEKHVEVSIAKELQPFEAVRWLRQEAAKKNVHFASRAEEFFVEYVGTDQWRLDSELSKLSLAGGEITAETIRSLVEPTPQATSFELLDAALRGQTEDMERLFRIVSREEDPYMFFGLLAGQIYALSLVASGKTARPDDIAKATGVHPFVLKKVSGMAAQVSHSSLQALTSRLADLDANMKSRPVEPWTQVYSFLRSLA